MCLTPNTGSVWPSLTAGVLYRNLLPLWPYFRLSPNRQFGYPVDAVNRELPLLDNIPLPASVEYHLIWSGVQPTLVTRTTLGTNGYIDGDGIVPAFSQLGQYFQPDPAHPSTGQILGTIRAFQGRNMHVQMIAGPVGSGFVNSTHALFMEDSAVGSQLYDILVAL